MWRYLESVKPPQKHKTPEEKATYFRDYDKNKRTRSCQSEWEQGRSWLKDTDNEMVCTICQENGDPSTNMFITGCTSYKLDSFSKHEKSKGHEKSAAIAKSESNVNSDAYKILKMLNSENFEKPNKMFRTCHAMVKNNRLFSIIRFCMALPAG
jgi:hypothetical protein